jgi:hypothetical protein
VLYEGNKHTETYILDIDKISTRQLWKLKYCVLDFRETGDERSLGSLTANVTPLPCQIRMLHGPSSPGPNKGFLLYR